MGGTEGLTCQRGLGDVGGHHTLPDAVRGPLEDLGLQVAGQLRVDGQDGQGRGLVQLLQTL